MIAFLQAHGVEPAAAPIVVEFPDRLPADAPPQAVACFDRRSLTVTVLSFRAFAERREWFGVPIDRRLHGSVVAHEVAHAVVGREPAAARVSRTGHEYIAYVAMLATMDPPLRERVLARFPGDGFEAEAQFNAFVYAFDPERFGVEAYRHFLRHQDPAGWLRRILDGAALVDFTGY